MPQVFKVGLIAAWLFSSSAAQEVTVVMTSEDSLSTYFQLTETLFPEWVAYFKGIDPDFNESALVLTSDGTNWPLADNHSFDISQGLTLRDSIFFEFSPDSTRFVDINAYAFVFEEQGMKRIGFDVDAAIRVGDVSRAVSYQIDHTGSSWGFLEARWIDADRIIIVGHDYVDHFPECIPFFKLYDLTRRRAARFHSKRHYPCARRPYATSIDKRMEKMGVTRY